MTKPFTENSFSSTYKDDFIDSDNYHRILFNSGRALQARELTQLQTIIQEEIGRFGRNIFKDGASVNPGGPSVNNRYEFIKLNTTVNSLPTDFATTVVGSEFTGQTSGVKVRVLEVVPAEGSDPATLYVQYTNTSSGSAGATPIRVNANEDLSDGSTTLTVQQTNSVANPAVGRGTQFSNGGGDFFVRGHFVFAKPQSIILSKYTTNPDAEVGFVVVEDIVTVDDDDALYDNQGATPNRSSPGADRYRIRLLLHNKTDVTSDENFVHYATVVDGEITENVQGTGEYNKINDLLATRTSEESGDYLVKPFDIDFSTDSEDAGIKARISGGTAYINGYRANRNDPTTITLNKPRTTQEFSNEVAGINYGQYFICGTLEGKLPVDTLADVNLRSAVDYGGSTIGKAKVRYVEEDGSNFRVYLFAIRMNSGQVLRDVKSFGTGANDFANPVLEGSTNKAVIKDTQKNSLLFRLPRSRPRAISDVDFEVQRIVTGTSNASGSLALAALTVTGETFVNTGQWIVTRDDTGAVVTPSGFTGSGTTSVTINGLPNSTAVTVYAKVNKASPTIRVKQKTENATITGTLLTVGNETFLNLGKADVFKIREIRATNSSGRDISGNFSFDNGQRPGYYGPSRIIRNNNSSITGTVYVKFDYFAHQTGDVFAVNSYDGQQDYSKIPSVETAPRQYLNLRDVVDFRPSTPDSGLDFTASGAVINELPTSGDIFQGDVDYYVPRAEKIVLNEDGDFVTVTGEVGFQRPMPETPLNTLCLFEIRHNAYGIGDSGVYSDLALKVHKYKRFTMKDISRVEEKLENLRETVSLSQLEIASDTLLVLDSDGIARTKSGILADNFKDNAFKDIQDLNNRSTIYATTKTMGPEVAHLNVNLYYDSDKSSNVIKKGDNIYLTFTEQEVIKQTLVSGTENVNPFAVVSGEGRMKLSPSSDWWMDTKFAADNIINKTVETNADAVFEGEFDVTSLPNPNFAFNFNPFRTRGGLNVPGNLLNLTDGQIAEGLFDNEFNIDEPGQLGGGNVGGFADAFNWGWAGININPF